MAFTEGTPGVALEVAFELLRQLESEGGKCKSFKGKRPRFQKPDSQFKLERLATELLASGRCQDCGMSPANMAAPSSAPVIHISDALAAGGGTPARKDGGSGALPWQPLNVNVPHAGFN
jgi:hypothetical protein